MPRLQGNGFVARGTEIGFEMDGVPCRAIEGETIAAALIASGHRSFKRGRHGERRGFSCGMGACFECEVSIDGAAPERACMTKVRAGMRVASTQYRKPLPNIHAAAATPSRECIHADVLVIGGGPAGMTAAVELDGAGVSVVLADERADPGGQFYKQPAASQDYAAGRPPDSQYAEGRVLIERLRGSGTRLLNGATVWGAFRGDGDNFETGIRSPGASYLLRSRAILVATGAFEPIPAFPGWTLPGVMS
ncbi:MAG: 2Fe-2S iron-sulfur cluster-binding protein, partial [Pseudomonadota bacterium]